MSGAAGNSPTGCGAPPGGIKVSAGTRDEAVVQGRVTRSGAPVPDGYARLLNADGEFVAEVTLGDDGGFIFYAAPGDWTVRILAPGGVRAERAVTARTGSVSEIEVPV